MIKEINVDNVIDINNLGSKLNPNFANLYDYSSLNEDVNKTYVIWDNNRIIGFIHIQDLIDEVDIIDIVIDDIYRRKGYGRKLVQFIIDKYLNKKIILEVAVDNIPAINLYKSFYFQVINTRKGYYNGTDALIMEKK